MTDTDRFGTEVATSKEEIEGTWSIDGETYDLITEDTTKGTLNLIQQYMEVANEVAMADDPENLPDDLGDDLPNLPWENEEDADKDIIEVIVDGKLIEPQIDVHETPIRKLRALYEGMMDAWGEGDLVRDARDQMPLDEGNGSRSPNGRNRR